VVSVGPGGFEVARSVRKLAQVIGTDCAALMPQIARHVVTEFRTGLEFGNGCDEFQNR
jgi:hypothetical protein